MVGAIVKEKQTIPSRKKEAPRTSDGSRSGCESVPVSLIFGGFVFTNATSSDQLRQSMRLSLERSSVYCGGTQNDPSSSDGQWETSRM